MSYKNYKWGILGRDNISPYFRNYIWTEAFFRYPELLDISRFVVGIASEKNRISYLVNFDSWNKCHKELKQKVEKDYRFIDKLIDKTNKLGDDFNNWTEKKIFNADVKSFNSKKIVKVTKEFFERQGELYALGVALPVLDIQNYKFVEGNLEKILKEKVSEKDYQKYYEVFTHPTHNSFSQDQEEDLLKLMAGHKKVLKELINIDLQDIVEKYPKFYRDLQNHTKKYGWVYYVYAGPAFGEQKFLDFILDYINQGIDPVERLEEIDKEKEKIKDLKKEYFKKLKPNDFGKVILNVAGKMVWGKPRRKDYQSKSYYHLEKLQREIARRLMISLEQTRSIPLNMLQEALEKSEIDINIINFIYDRHVVLPNDDGTVELLIGKEAEDFMTEIKKEVDSKKPKGSSVRGTCACSGKVQGTVKVINLPEDIQKMEKGDILVSIATTPSIVPAMKKAAAIVTDEGGLTCHAAIVSRELSIPSVIGTEISTQIFKDGDLVEVDADKGVVKKINKV